MQSKATIGGVLSIAGAIGTLLGGAWITLIVWGSISYTVFGIGGGFWIVLAIYLLFSLMPLGLGVLAVLGGISAIRRKRWGLALAGSIAACFTFTLLGVPAAIIIAISQAEFLPNALPAPPTPPVPSEGGSV